MLMIHSLSAAELDELFDNKVKPWRFHKTQTALQKSLAIQRQQQ
jgi:hypothetical protein